MQQLAPALPAALGYFGLELLEPALSGPALQAHGDPVAERLPALLAQPVRGLAHVLDCTEGAPSSAWRPSLRRGRNQPLYGSTRAIR